MRGILTGILIILLSISARGQATYPMANQTVTDCYGTLTDSEAGQTAGHYDHNEDFTFVICPPNASQVQISFSQFCTEAILDVLRIFDGPDTNSTLIGSWSGANANPGTITSTGGCLTIHFKSDANVSCTGWIADWTVTLQPPTPPQITGTQQVSCFSNTFQFTLSQAVPCDSVYAAAFNVFGPGNPSVVQANPVNCTGGMTNTISLTLNPGFSDNGNHRIEWVYRYKDVCDSIWTFLVQHNFQVTDCPLSVVIDATPDTICQGDCAQLTANASGGDPNTYQYVWNQGLPASSGPHTVCPTSTTTYQVTVSDNSPSPSATATQTVVVVPKPNAGTDRSVCLFSGTTQLNGFPAGGWWAGPGIINGAQGSFHSDSAGVGMHQVLYWRNGCADTVNITVEPVFAGFDDAACPGAAPFQVTGGIPSGGTWSGSGITPGGQFNPVSPGTYQVTYTAPNGCQHAKNIHVAPLQLPTADTTCTSLTQYLPQVQPTGGRWSGIPGINPITGALNPNALGPGQYMATYSLQGCSANLQLTVQNIQVPNSAVACPAEGIIQLPNATPGGGYWTGRGIVDSLMGTFDANDDNGGNFNAPLVYHVDACTDTMMMYVRQTRIYEDTLWFCNIDSTLFLNWANVRRTPGNGNWSGPGVVDPNYPGIFNPLVAGPGTHVLTYTANTCTDSIVMVVYPTPATQGDTTVCETAQAFTLQTSYPGGTWSGTATTSQGVFDPQQSGLGDFDIVYTHFIGCTDTMQVSVDPRATIQIQPPAPYFCFQDTLIVLQATPQGGQWQGSGIVQDSLWNPRIAGTGTHTLYYQYGSGDCAVVDSISIEVDTPISVQLPFAIDSICYGDYIQISATASGGGTGIFTYQWSNGLGSRQSISVNPTTTTTYSVTVSDGCSAPASAQLTVYVHPQIRTATSHGPKVCYGDTGWAAIRPVGQQNYSFEWSTNPPHLNDTLFGPGGDYNITVTDINTGCRVVRQATIPGYAFINARFTFTPNTDCIDILNPTVQLIDNSTGATKGYWDFGDGTTRPYQPGATLSHTYADTGQYLVTLFLENDGGCKDSTLLPLCVDPAKTLFVPNGFTPNNDGMNDVFKARGIGITSFRMMIFNRWGEKLFETHDIDQGWDGTVNGELVMNDVYTYLIAYTDLTSPLVQYKKGVVAIVR